MTRITKKKTKEKAARAAQPYDALPTPKPTPKPTPLEKEIIKKNLFHSVGYERLLSKICGLEPRGAEDELEHNHASPRVCHQFAPMTTWAAFQQEYCAMKMNLSRTCK